MADWLVTINDKIIKGFSLNDGERVTIGRGKEADIVIDNTAISRQHVALEFTSGIFLVSDLGSKNGTYVNGKKISSKEPVFESDLIEFGKFTLRPADENDADNIMSGSMAADNLDLDEETLFITSAQASKAAPLKTKSRSTKTHISLISGESSPEELEIAGKSSIKIGKDPSCDLVIPGFFVAKAQCYIFQKDANFIIVPQKSWAGTFVNDIKITEEKVLKDNDIIKIRSTSLRFCK